MRRRRLWWWLAGGLVGLVLVPAALFGAWVWFTSFYQRSELEATLRKDVSSYVNVHAGLKGRLPRDLREVVPLIHPTSRRPLLHGLQERAAKIRFDRGSTINAFSGELTLQRPKARHTFRQPDARRELERDISLYSVLGYE